MLSLFIISKEVAISSNCRQQKETNPTMNESGEKKPQTKRESKINKCKG